MGRFHAAALQIIALETMVMAWSEEVFPVSMILRRVGGMTYRKWNSGTGATPGARQ